MDDELRSALLAFLRKQLKKSHLQRQDRRRVRLYCQRTVHQNLEMFRNDRHLVTTASWEPLFIGIYNSALYQIANRSKRILCILKATIQAGSFEQISQRSRVSQDGILQVLKGLPFEAQLTEVAVARLEGASDDQIRRRFELTDYELEEHHGYFTEMVANEIAYHQQLFIAFGDEPDLLHQAPFRSVEAVENYIRLHPQSRMEQLNAWRAMAAAADLSPSDSQFATEVLDDQATKVHGELDHIDRRDIYALIEILRNRPTAD